MKNKSILFISHDSNRAGAQLLLKDVLLHCLKKGSKVYLLIMEKYGDIFNDLPKSVEIIYWPKKKKRILFGRNYTEEQIAQKILDGIEVDVIYSNTIATAHIAPIFKNILNKPLVAHIHEMWYSINMYAHKKDVIRFLNAADKIIACSKAVAQNLGEESKKWVRKTEVVYSFINQTSIKQIKARSKGNKLKKKLGLHKDTILVTGCGNAEWRKGTDWFVQTAKFCPNFHFAWIGTPEEGRYRNKLEFDLKRMGVSNVSLIPVTPNAKEYVNDSDIFYLSSREDPFPLAMLEAALLEKPVIAFKNSGGAEELLENDHGILCSYGDTIEVSKKLEELSTSPSIRDYYGQKISKRIENTFSSEKSLSEIESLLIDLIS